MFSETTNKLLDWFLIQIDIIIVNLTQSLIFTEWVKGIKMKWQSYTLEVKRKKRQMPEECYLSINKTIDENVDGIKILQMHVKVTK